MFPMFRARHPVAALACLLLGCGPVLPPALAACEAAFYPRAGGEVTGVAVVRDRGCGRDAFDFRWDGRADYQSVRTRSGDASGACTIDRATGEGRLTLGDRDLGTSRAPVPLADARP